MLALCEEVGRILFPLFVYFLFLILECCQLSFKDKFSLKMHDLSDFTTSMDTSPESVGV